MSKKIIICILLVVSWSLFSCQDDIKKKEAYRKGNLTIGIDPSFLNLAKALTDVFQSSYPDAKIQFKTEVEDLVIADFVNGKITMAMVGRDLTEEEGKILFNRTRIKYIPSQIACDATVFITAIDSEINEVSISDIKSGIHAADNKFIFDGGNTSNFNNVIKKTELTLDKNQKIVSLTNAEAVIDFVSKNKSQIGIIGFDILSDEDDPKVKELLTRIKIIPVILDKNEKVEPTVPNLRTGKYPFTKRIYLLNAESGFLIGSSFARFTGSQRGQLIVAKAGLQPYYLYPRNVEITK